MAHLIGKKNKIEKVFLQDLGKLVVNYGFGPRSVGQSFYRQVPIGKWVLHVTFIPHKADIDVTVDVGVRVEIIEQLVNRYDTTVGERNKSKTLTIGAELGNIDVRRPLRWNLSSDQDIPNAARSMIDAFEKIGMPYLNRYSNLAEVYQLLSSSKPDEWISCPIHGARCMRAIAAAHALGRLGGLADLCDRCESLLDERHDLYLPELRRMCIDLRSDVARA